MIYINEIISEPWMTALAWTLFHSCWLACIFALFVQISRQLIPQKYSSLRYSLQSILLLGFLGSCLTVFGMCLPNTASNFGDLSLKSVSQNAPLFIGEQLQSSFSIWDTESIGQYLLFLLPLWFLGVLLFSFKLIFSWFKVNQLKNNGIEPVDPMLFNLLIRLKNKAGIKKSIKFYNSVKVKTPIVIGALKPVILFPVGLATGLSENEIKAILAHELAHIKRHDYFINIIQCLIEILFFFHPAIWWINSKIREERENCCDDFAVALCDDKLDYAKALTTLSQWQMDQPKLAMGLAKTNSQLWHRVHRLLSPSNHKSNKIGSLFLSLSFGILFVVFQQTGQAKKTFENNNFELTKELESEGQFITKKKKSLPQNSIKNTSAPAYGSSPSNESRIAKEELKFSDQPDFLKNANGAVLKSEQDIEENSTASKEENWPLINKEICTIINTQTTDTIIINVEGKRDTIIINKPKKEKSQATIDFETAVNSTTSNKTSDWWDSNINRTVCTSRNLGEFDSLFRKDSEKEWEEELKEWEKKTEKAAKEWEKEIEKKTEKATKEWEKQFETEFEDKMELWEEKVEKWAEQFDDLESLEDLKQMDFNEFPIPENLNLNLGELIGGMDFLKDLPEFPELPELPTLPDDLNHKLEKQLEGLDGLFDELNDNLQNLDTNINFEGEEFSDLFEGEEEDESLSIVDTLEEMLINDGLVDLGEDYSFKVNEKNISLNGNTLPGHIEAKYYDYLHERIRGNFSYKENGTSIKIRLK